MKKPLLSIIVPAYNAEKTIGKLIESIINQKCNEYELIIINDGSKDKTKEIIKSYLNKSEKIVFIDKENTGVGDTRNRGLEIAKGKYIAFADSDDYYAENYFDEIIPEMKKDDYELLVFNAHVMNFGKITNNEIPNKYKEGYFTENNGIIRYLIGDYCHRISNVPWNKIYLKEIIDKYNIRYDKNKVRGQDLLFNVEYVAKISKYKYINKKLYYYQYDTNIYKNTKYNSKEISENLKYYDAFKKICIDNKVNNYLQYIGLFFLRRFPGLVVNEANNNNYRDGLQNLNNYLNNEKIKETLCSVKLKHLDFKLIICYIFLKFKLYKLFYFIFWKKKNKN